MIHLAVLAEPPRSAYRVRKYPARLLAVALTAVVHLIIVSTLVYEWRQPVAPPASESALVVTLIPLAPDKPAVHRKWGTTPSKPRPPSSPADPPPVPVVRLPVQPPIAVTAPAYDLPAPVDSGKGAQLAQDTQAYQRALLARLDEQRRYPTSALLDGLQGAGSILLHVDRQGHLLDASIEVSTGREGLDRAALALVRRAAPFPVIPAELPDLLSITVPIEFLIVTPGNRIVSR